MIIAIGAKEPPLEGLLRYAETEYSFDFDVGSPAELSRRTGESGVTSILIGTLQIEVGVATRRALYVWGLHPRNRWTSARLTRPVPDQRAVVIDPERTLTPGVSVGAAPVGAWSTEFDDESGWVRVAADAAVDDMVAEIADGILLGERDGELHSVWLRPLFE